MDAGGNKVDLEKELTCSICTDVFYQPLTLLDCLHSFCGACLKEWFSWQAVAAETSPSPPLPGAPIFTCPSCRAAVRDTRRNATVNSLVELFLAANPGKAKSVADQADMDKQYKPGDNVLPAVKIRHRTPEQRRLDDVDRQLIEDVRNVSLLEVMNRPSASSSQSLHPPRSGRRHEGRTPSHSRERRSSHSRIQDVRASSQDATSRSSRTQDREQRRRTLDAHNRQRATQTIMLEPEDQTRVTAQTQTQNDRANQLGRPIAHQSSIRSMISSSDIEHLDIDKEVEEFARQIRDEGLLDGVDLDNIDLTNDDELSRKITEAYRRRQRERHRHIGRRSRRSSHNVIVADTPSAEQQTSGDESSRPRSQHHEQSGSVGIYGHSGSRARIPASPSRSQHLEVRKARHRRTTSGSRERSTTAPVSNSQPQGSRAVSRSQTDLTIRSTSNHAISRTPRPNISDEWRSISSPVTATSIPDIPAAVESPTSSSPLSNRMTSNDDAAPSSLPSTVPQSVQRPQHRPAVIATGAGSSANFRLRETTVASPLQTLPASTGQRAPLYPEPSVTCSSCQREHIEYELHYNCAHCYDGHWNICLSCYRLGKGCLYWFGFGQGGWQKFERLRKVNPQLAEPHKLLASRYLPPRNVTSGADGGKILTHEDPDDRLQSGTFCALCLTWTNNCYWRCEACNEGDWGFCNNCVNQGRSCTHPLYPLAYRLPSSATDATPPSSPRMPAKPRGASFESETEATRIGPFQALTFTTTCDVCRKAIAPSAGRFHCFSCVSEIVQQGHSAPLRGEYDVCDPCYRDLSKNGKISAENGVDGWRRCLNGHRMIVIGFTQGKVGRQRYIVQDLVGGRRLQVADDQPLASENTQVWTWNGGDAANTRMKRLVTRDVAASTTGPGDRMYPPDGGYGMIATAGWAWYPAAGAYDELLFPKGAEIREIEDVNGEWFHGVYMGAKGMFPAPYVTVLDGVGSA